MSMTREEAIALFEKQLTAAQVVLDSGFGSNPGENNSLYRRRKEMAEIALSALRPVSREQVEKVWPGCEACKNAGLAIGEVQFYGPFEGSIDVSGNMQYCPNCGRPITPAAQEGQLERLEALHEVAE